MSLSAVDEAMAYVDKPMVVVVIKFAPFSSVKPPAPSVIDDAGVDWYGFVMSMI